MSRMRLPNRKNIRRKGALERLEAQLASFGRLDGVVKPPSPEKVKYVKDQIEILKSRVVGR